MLGKSIKLRVYSPQEQDRLNVLASQHAQGETMNRNTQTAEFMKALIGLQQMDQSTVLFVEGEPVSGAMMRGPAVTTTCGVHVYLMCDTCVLLDPCTGYRQDTAHPQLLSTR